MMQIVGNNGIATVTRIFTSKTAKKRYWSKEGVVLIIEVKEGFFEKGEPIMIESLDYNVIFLDIISRIELNHKKMQETIPGKTSYGICLRMAEIKKIMTAEAESAAA